MSEVPEQLRYTAEHEWAELIGETTVRVGITAYAQNSLGDIVFVSVNGGPVQAGATFGEVESTKSVSDLFAPLTASQVRPNADLESNPELINSDPYGRGWIAELVVEYAGALDELLDAAAYRALIDG